MCGIITYISKDKNLSASEEIMNQYQDQFSRGTKGFGSAFVYANEVIVKRATEPTKALIDINNHNSPVTLFHHRHPTSTENKRRQTHPISVSNKKLKNDWLVIHNGIISNDQDLFEEHEKLGFKYSTYEKTNTVTGYKTYYDKFNDSEALAIELARYLESQETYFRPEGSIAFVALQINKKTKKPTKLFFGRESGSPLEILETEHGFLIASDIDNEMGQNVKSIDDQSYFTLDLAKYFERKSAIKKILQTKLISKELKLAIKPKPEKKTTAISVKTKTNKVSTPATTSKTVVSKHVYDYPKHSKYNYAEEYMPGLTQAEMDDIEDYNAGFHTQHTSKSAWEQIEEQKYDAYITMAERVCDDINLEIQRFFGELTNANLTEDDVLEVTNLLHELMMEKTNSSNSQIRAHWDRRIDDAIQQATLPLAK